MKQANKTEEHESKSAQIDFLSWFEMLMKITSQDKKDIVSSMAL